MSTTQMKRIALTGGMGTGKSHVRAVFAALGVPTIDADTLARDVVAHGTPGFDAVVAKFGRGILNADGDLDRRALAAQLSSDEKMRRATHVIHTDGAFEETARQVLDVYNKLAAER